MVRREIVKEPGVGTSTILRVDRPTGSVGAGASGPGRLWKEVLSDQIKVGALLTRTYRTGAAMTEVVLKTKVARRSLATKEIILARKNDKSIEVYYQEVL